MSRKVFISFLGEGFYTKVQYNQGKEQLQPSRFIQRATLEHIDAIKWGHDDVAYILLTNVAYQNNWEVSQRKNPKTNVVEEYIGLKQELDEMNLPFEVKELPIKDGNNDSEMFEIFLSLFSNLQADDKLYLDMTHGFRYLPMFLLVMANYAQLLLKEVKIMSMSYGNLFTEKKDIMDLLPLYNLQRWTIGAADFVKNGSVSDLVEMAKSEVLPIVSQTKGKDEKASNIRKFTDKLDEVIDHIKLCRCKDLITAKSIKQLREVASKLDMSENTPVFAPIKDRIMDSLKEFSSTESIRNGFAAASWCLDNHLYQQCISYLEETTISFFCKKYNLPLYEVNERTMVGYSFNIVREAIPEERWGLGHDESKKESNKKLLQMLTQDIDIELSIKYCSMSDLRNDMNHTGMRTNGMPIKKLKQEIETALAYFKTYFENWDVH